MDLELIFAGLFGILIGAAAIPFAKPLSTIGLALLPGIGGATALIYWVAASWAMRLFNLTFLRYDAGNIWLYLVVIVAAVCFSIALMLPKRRAEADEDLLERLSHRSSIS
ncbi:hypothetical protein [Gulosibacter bifidus]|uniref:Uncharacterized protein n=1 Tax=Gulosibacter bifidus TaxID=272239 RepID=A0ABW5RJG9_9MICO|nr:hypothetical protein [Gulosibacter bifidus]